ncbi:carboxypeptidase-like regulatory domain-containing protein [Flavobacterium crassostreae]|uniref:TonB-dependent receptor n=1 Tax=Flavobacterium crassostreae TaxID=1763534 RepID=A0A1B9E5Q0_9FLAO|nr:carboxypeptidase-like regulatory domain-containing protein [Flavobacterium crassostreae]OCB77249.1 TonB-dependent receptor [Flavobacterium crassostreae]
MKQSLFKLFFIFCASTLYSQTPTGLTGKVLDAKTQQPLSHVVVTIPNTNKTQLTSATGTFNFSALTTGKQLVLFRSQGYKEALYPVVILPDQIVDLGSVVLEHEDFTDLQTTVIQLFDADLTEEDSGSETISGILQSSKDNFQRAAAFNWGQARFKVRGLPTEYATISINSIPMNKLYDGRPQWSNWGGLNDALRNQEFTLGTEPSDHNFGNLLGTQEINTRASSYRAGTKVTLSGTNTNYSWRAMTTHASGTSRKGWSYVISAGKRHTQEGYFEGTTYNATSVLIGLEKQINTQHSIHFTGIYTPNTRGKNSPNTDEVVALTSPKYNAYWGYQNGQKRNSRVKTVQEPIWMLQHLFKINAHTNLNSSIMYQSGKIGNSKIDYQNGNSPDPTYFRKLPSYFSALYAPDSGQYSGDFTPDHANAQKNKQAFLAQPQLDWAALYRANQIPVTDSKGTIIQYQPAKSHYVLYEDRTDDQLFVANVGINSQISGPVSVQAAVTVNKLQSHNYQKLIDLLGGTYFEDIDPFYKGSQAQSDLNNPNRRVGLGDSYGYNYTFLASTFAAFTQFKFTYNTIDFYLAQTFSTTQYQREGKYKNGIYPNTSLGKSSLVSFDNFGFKGGITYKISGKQWLYCNAAQLTKAPSLRNTFANSRLNNATVEGLESETSSSLDLNYVFRAPKFKARLTAYYIARKGASRTSFFYAEGIFDNGAGDTNTNAFVSQNLTHINTKNTGLELSLEQQLSSTIQITLAAAYGNYIYDNNPNLIVNNDALATPENPKPTFDFGKAALKNYKQPGMPQEAYSLGIAYRDPKYWWIAPNLNYLRASYVDFSAITRTNSFNINPASGFPFPEATLARAKELLQQERFPDLLMLNLIGGKSWRINRKYLGLFVSVQNVLDKIYKSGGYEQARNGNFRQLDQDVSSGTPTFGNKYYYGYGRTFFVNLSFSF